MRPNDLRCFTSQQLSKCSAGYSNSAVNHPLGEYHLGRVLWLSVPTLTPVLFATEIPAQAEAVSSSTAVVAATPNQFMLPPEATPPAAIAPETIAPERTSSTAEVSGVVVPTTVLPVQPSPAEFMVATDWLAQDIPRERRFPNPLEEPNRPILPPRPKPLPDELFEFPETPDNPVEPVPTSPANFPDTIQVKRFEIEGSTIYSQSELTRITDAYLNKDLSFTDLNQVATDITERYIKAGYINSGAYISADQPFQDGVVQIKVLEGGLEAIEIKGTRRLKPAYIRQRIELAAGKPLNVNRLVEALQLLQLSPLFTGIKAELINSPTPGMSILQVEVAEADTFRTELELDNERSPAVGTIQRRIQVSEANLTGRGDQFILAYSNTNGSNSADVYYSLPFNPRNGTFNLSYSFAASRVIEEPFDALNIESTLHSVDVNIRQPLIQTPRTEFAIGAGLSHRFSRATFEDGDDEIPFPALGSDVDGQTRITALRFFQEWSTRSERSVLALRSQFNIGIDAFSATTNLIPPDSRFFSWQGQAQWVRLLAPQTLLIVRGEVQFGDRPLVSSEQFGIGGADSVRGYRQDQLLTDNGVFASAELRVPILRMPKQNGVLQFTPFVEVGKGWNSGDVIDPDPSLLASAGIGLRLQLSDRLTARISWGIPLVEVNGSKNSWQEQGIYFSVNVSPF